MSRVYVVQEQPRYNLAPALDFGEIRTLLPPGDANFSSDHVYDKLLEGLKDFDCDTDWLLLMGDPVAIGLATFIASSGQRLIRFLKWDKQERHYLPITVNL